MAQALATLAGDHLLDESSSFWYVVSFTTEGHEEAQPHFSVTVSFLPLFLLSSVPLKVLQSVVSVNTVIVPTNHIVTQPLVVMLLILGVKSGLGLPGSQKWVFCERLCLFTGALGDDGCSTYMQFLECLQSLAALHLPATISCTETDAAQCYGIKHI